VLVVEDEPEIAALVRDFLEADGFRVRVAADAGQAAGALRPGPDCVLLDVMLPHERGVKLRVMAPTGPSVMIHRAALARALTNVLDNALRHTPPGGAVDVTVGEDAVGAFVEVVDDGPGIAPDLLPRLFEPIDRADNTTNGGPHGAGLGLTIAARLLRNQGGTISAANAPERGARLTLRIPRTQRRFERNGSDAR
jgi:signal transduction histidine kinase